MPFNDLVIQTNQVRLKSGSQRRAPFSAGNGWFASSWKFLTPPPPPHVLYFETIQPDWPAVWSSSLATKVASSSTNAETAGEIWAFVSVRSLPPLAGPSYQLQSDKSLIFVSFQTPKKKLNTRLLCSLCLVELLMCLLPLRWTNAPLLTRACISRQLHCQPEQLLLHQRQRPAQVQESQEPVSLCDPFRLFTHSDLLELHAVRRPSYQ